MIDPCSSGYTAYGCDWDLGYFWHQTAWRVVLGLLAAMLAYVFCAAVRFAYLQTSSDASAVELARRRAEILAEHRRRVASLGSIAFIAPYVGLSGTCSCIFSSFRGVGMERSAALALLFCDLATALVPTAAGILVAVAAVWAQSYLCRRVDMLEREWLATQLDVPFNTQGQQRWHLKFEHARNQRFLGLPPFGMVAASFLGIIVALSLGLPHSSRCRGLPVGIVSSPRESSQPFSGEPLVRVKLNSSEILSFFVRGKPISFTQLEEVFLTDEGIQLQRLAYLEADGDLSWEEVTRAVDRLRVLGATVVLVTGEARTRHLPPAANGR
jgi:biopolymer transport protein ExbD